MKKDSLLICLFLISPFFAPSIVHAQEKVASRKPSLTVSTALVEVQPWPITLSATGVIAAWQEAIVSSRAVNLPIVELTAELGAYVKRGEILARFDNRSALADLAQAYANLAQASATHRQTEANRDRTLALKESGAVSEESILQAVTQAEISKAQVAVAEANVDSASVRLENTTVTAPDSGVVASRTATLGQSYGTSSELFRLIRQNRLEWRAEVAAESLAQIVPGQAATIELPGGLQGGLTNGLPSGLPGVASALVKGKVRQVAPILSSISRMGIVYVDIASNNAVRPAMFVKGSIATGSNSAVVVPAESVVLRDGRPCVFVVTGDKVQKVTVTTGRRKGKLIEIAEGLSINQQVVVRGAGFLSDGDVIQITEAKR
jgi:RND family efflux transporter MFP subunit